MTCVLFVAFTVRVDEAPLAIEAELAEIVTVEAGVATVEAAGVAVPAMGVATPGVFAEGFASASVAGTLLLVVVAAIGIRACIPPDAAGFI